MITIFRAVEKSNKNGRLSYDVYDTATPPAFRMDRYTGKLMAAMDVNRKLGEIVKVTIVATSLQTGANVREIVKFKVTPAINKYAPSFPSNGTTVLLPKTAKKSQTVWIADAVDKDVDELNNDIIYTEVVMIPKGFLEFFKDTGELKLEKAWNEVPPSGINVTIKACNRETAKPKLCGTTHITVAPDIPSMDSLLGNLKDIDAAKLGAVADAVETMAEFAKTDVKVNATVTRWWHHQVAVSKLNRHSGRIC